MWATLLSPFFKLGNIFGVELVLLFWLLTGHGPGAAKTEILSRRVFRVKSTRRIAIAIAVLSRAQKRATLLDAIGALGRARVIRLWQWRMTLTPP